MTIHKSHYDLLGVDRTADIETIHMAFRRLSKELHPDTTNLPTNEAALQFRLLCQAYELLADPQRRKTYDANLEANTYRAHSTNQFSSNKQSNSFNKTKVASVLRPLSSGEIFSLFILIGTLIFSLFIGVGFAWVNGKQLQVLPSWLYVDQTIEKQNIKSESEINTATSPYGFK